MHNRGRTQSPPIGTYLCASSERYSVARLLREERKRRATRDGRLARPTTGSGDRFGKVRNGWAVPGALPYPLPTKASLAVTGAECL
eukprot:2823083-Rhodomonas_salina.1